MRGHEIMQTTSRWVEELGYQVIYGDTDSTFIWIEGEYSSTQCKKFGQQLAVEINQKWQEKIRNEHDLARILIVPLR